MRKVILLTAMPKEGVWSSSIYVNGGSKVTFCVKHNLISTFFNFVFYCTLVFIMCFLTAGNICAQTPLPLYVDNGASSNPRYAKCGFNYDFKIEENGTKVLFMDDGTDPLGYYAYSCVGGANWADSYSEGQTHTFTVTLNPYSGPLDPNDYPEPWSRKDVVGELHIVALDSVISNPYDSYYGKMVKDEYIALPAVSTEQLVLTLEVNKSYKAVYLYKKNRGGGQEHDREYVDIASVTRTVETPVAISEEVDNTLTAQTGATVNLTRTLVAGTWNTICLPFVPTPEQADAIFGEGAKFAQFSSVSNGVMQFTSVAGSLEAGKPYLVLPTKSQTVSSPIKLTGVTIEAAATNAGHVTIGDYTFQGIYRLTPFPINDRTIRFVAANNKLKYPSTPDSDNPTLSTPLKALRAYISLPNAQTSNGAKDYFEVDSFVPTSIANIQIEGDGDGAIYNIGGQRVEGKSLPKGIYIRDGKKFVVK